MSTIKIESGTPSRLGPRAKRVFDVSAAAAGVIFLSPLLLLLIALITITSPGPVFYGHKRVGRFGREFRCWKFRTMVTNGEALLAAHFAAHPEDHMEWLRTRKLQRDPRVTPVGRILRKLSLDELPQLINIITGEMSVVGPRPVVADELSYYGVHQDCYLQTRPGLTGLWQVSGRSDVSYERRVDFDRQYSQDWTFALDMMIILRTIPAVCFARGSV